MKRPKSAPAGLAEDAAPTPQPRKRASIAQRAHDEKHPARRAVNLTASSYLLREAKTLDLNLSKIFAEALERAVREAAGKAWAVENAAAIEAYNKDIRENGLWSDEFRPW